MKKLNKSRRFKSATRFVDGTEYVSVYKNGKVYAVDLDGKKTELSSSSWSLVDCLRYVKQKDWVEIK